MAKLSRPVVYSFVAAVAVYAAVVLTQPDAPAPHRRSRPVRHVAAGVNAATTAADLTAHFARYHPTGKRNPFLSGLPRAGAKAGPKSGGAPGGGRGEWTLTGVNIINGTPNALVENGATGESAFLKPGDRWRGLRVLSIGPGAVAFLNALGQKTRLTFRPTAPVAPAPGAAAGGGRLQGLGAVRPLPPMPVLPGSVRPLPTLPPLGTPSAPRGR